MTLPLFPDIKANVGISTHMRSDSVAIVAYSCASIDSIGRRISIEKDTKVTNAATFTLQREDHTVGNLVRM